MNYQWHYDSLMSTRKDRIKDPVIYYEKHHIIPKSMGGDNSKENIVYLTGREHFIAHWLLWRIHRNRKMMYAFKMMCEKGKDGKFYKSSLAYAEAREAQRDFQKGKSPMEGRKMTDIHKERILFTRNNTYEKRREETGKCFSVKDDTKLKISEGISGEKNGMHNTSFYEKWVIKYGKDEADRKKRLVYENRVSKGKSKTLEFISPSGECFLIEGGMKSFCIEHTLNYGYVSQVLNNKRENDVKGWKIFEKLR